MQPVIYLAFVDDWEVRGNGTGDPRVLQFEPMRKLVSIFNAHGIRGSFNVEVMQQLAYRSLQGRFPELRVIADDWDEVVLESFRQGHDIQLHLHPQWREATYEGDGNWKLGGDWSILNYPKDEIKAMIASGKQYLEHLLRKVNPAYACVSFRSGAWCAAPSDSLLPILSELGFLFDMSIVAGIKYDTPQVSLDYTGCEESFAPYYPDMRDARRVSRSVEPIVCIPTNTFRGGPALAFNKLRQRIQKLDKRNTVTTKPSSRGRSGDEWSNKGESGSLATIRRLVKRYLIGQSEIADLAQLNYAMMRRMMTNIRRQAARSGLVRVPVILENHTKDIHDFTDIERFVAAVARSQDVKAITLTEIANGLRNGTFKPRSA